MLRRLFQFVAFSATASLAVAQSSALVTTRTVDTASVAMVQASSLADLVLVDGGFESGFRQGMICTISRSGVKVADVLLVELRSQSSAALIVEMADGQSILRGDLVSVKTLKA